MRQKPLLQILNTLFLLMVMFVVLVCTTNAQSKEKSFTLGIPSTLLEPGFSSFTDYIEKNVNISINLVVLESYEELIEKIIVNEVQFAFLGPVQYVETKWQYPELKYLATTETTVNKTQRAYYFGNIVVLRGSAITDLSQLQNKSFAFIDPSSSSGYRFPRIFLYKRGINPQVFFKTVTFAGTHAKGTDLLAAGKVDAVSTWDLNLWTAQQKHGDIFRPIAKIGPIVQLAVVANHNVPQNIASAVQKVLAALQPEDISGKFPFTGFTVFSDRSYDNVREIYTFPFLDTLAPNLLNAAVQSEDLNSIFKAFNALNYQKETIKEFIKNELQDGVFTVTGKVSAFVENIPYGDGWYSLKKGFLLSSDTGHEVYVKGKGVKTELKLSDPITLRGRIIGIKGFNSPVMERVEDLL